MFSRKAFPRLLGASGGSLAMVISSRFILPDAKKTSGIHNKYEKGAKFFLEPFTVTASTKITEKCLLIGGNSVVTISTNRKNNQENEYIVSVKYGEVDYLSHHLRKDQFEQLEKQLSLSPHEFEATDLFITPSGKYAVEVWIPTRDSLPSVLFQCYREVSKREVMIDQIGDTLALFIIGGGVGGMVVRSARFAMLSYSAQTSLRLGDCAFIGATAALETSPVAVFLAPLMASWRHWTRIFDQSSCVNQEGVSIWPKYPYKPISISAEDNGKELLKELVSHHATFFLITVPVGLFFGTGMTALVTVPIGTAVAMATWLLIE